MAVYTKRGAAVLAAVTLLVAACGGDDDSDPGDAPSTSEAPDTEGSETDASEPAEASDTDASEPADEPPVRAERLRMGTIVQPSSLQAAQGVYGNANVYYQALFDGLVRVEPDGVTVTPHLATEWSYDDTLTVLTMTLRDDVTFSDGTPFDAEAAAANLLRFRDANGPEAGHLSGMVDAVAVDATTLEITLDAQDPGLLISLSRPAGLMQSPSSLDAPDADLNPIGSGPYTLDGGRTVPDSVYVFVAREGYWAPETVHFDEIELRYIEDATATVNAVLAGELDATNLTDSTTIERVEGAGWTVEVQPLNWAGFTLLDRDGALGSPLGDPLVRQAINHAFDREAIMDVAVAGVGETTNQVFRPGSAGYRSDLADLYPYDVARAKELLAEAGYEDGFELEMPMSAILGEELFAVLDDQLAVIGVDAAFVESGPGEYISDVLSGSWPSYYMILEQSPNDWQFINFLVAPDAVWNPNGYTDDVVEGLLAEIATLPAGAEQDELIGELGGHVTEQAWYAPIYLHSSTFANSPDVEVATQIGNVVPYLWNIVPAG